MPTDLVISADSHINEPPDLWSNRVGPSLRDRAPRMQRFEQGDAWIVEGALDPINFGSNCSAGVEAEARRDWIRWGEVGEGGYLPASRVRDQDRDGVSAEVIYPTPRIGCALAWQRTDRALHLACIRAYNDWLSEFCAAAPNRLWGVAMLPNVGVDATVAELHRVLAMPGIRGVLFALYPHGGETPVPEDDLVWGLAAEASMPLSIHVTFATHQQGAKSRGKLTSGLRFLDAPIRASQFIFGGVFDRFRDLQLVLAEVDCGWVPYFAEQLDDRFDRAPSTVRTSIARRPSDYFAENVSCTFVTDRYGLRNRDAVGVSQIMWSSDYPHSGSDWPNSLSHIDRQLAGISPGERALILAGNACRLYGPIDGAAGCPIGDAPSNTVGAL